MERVRFEGGPLHAHWKLFVAEVPESIPVTATEGGGWSNVDSFYRLVDGVLVWVNPIQDGRDRSVLDTILREAAAAGVFVSGHPDVIARLGTKEVLHTTRDIGWGCDTRLYRSAGEMRQELPARLSGGARVLKQLRGHSGIVLHGV